MRRALLREMRAVISFDGSYVNYRHLATLCDVMTQKGHIMSITRNGINRVEKGCLAKCSFEETVEILMMAAAFAETDHLRGVTEHVMFGQLAPFGTGLCDLVIDEEKLRHTNPNYDASTYSSALAGGFHGQTFLGQDDITSPFSDGSGGPIIVSPSSMASSLLQQHQPARDFAATPFSPTSPMSPMGAVPGGGLSITSPSLQHDPLLQLAGQFSPIQHSPHSPTSPMSPYSPHAMTAVASPLGGVFSPATLGGTFAQSPTSNAYSITSPQYSPTSPVYSVTSPLAYSPGASGSMNVAGGYSVTSPTYSPTSPLITSKGGSAVGRYYSPTSPTYSPTSPVIASPTSPDIAARQLISPTSPHYAKQLQSPEYSPHSPSFSPTSPVSIQSPGAYSLTSPSYSPTSPSYGFGDVSHTGNPLSPGMVQRF